MPLLLLLLRAMENITTVNEFLLLELTSTQELQPVLFMTLLIIYMIDLFGNGSMLVVVISAKALDSYVFFPGKSFLSGYLLFFSDIAHTNGKPPVCSQGHIFPGLHHSATLLPLFGLHGVHLAGHYGF